MPGSSCAWARSSNAVSNCRSVSATKSHGFFAAQPEQRVHQQFRGSLQCHTNRAFSLRNSTCSQRQHQHVEEQCAGNPHRRDRYRWGIWKYEGNLLEASSAPPVLCKGHPRRNQSICQLTMCLTYLFTSLPQYRPDHEQKSP